MFIVVYCFYYYYCYYSSISNEPLLNTPWSSDSDDSWDRMRGDFRQLSPEFNTFGDKTKMQLEDEANGFTESVSLFLDLLIAYQVSLCNTFENKCTL